MCHQTRAADERSLTRWKVSGEPGRRLGVKPLQGVAWTLESDGDGQLVVGERERRVELQGAFKTAARLGKLETAEVFDAGDVLLIGIDARRADRAKPCAAWNR